MKKNVLENVVIYFNGENFHYSEAEIAVDPLGYLVVMANNKRHFFRFEDISYYEYDAPEEFEFETTDNVVTFN